MDRKQISHNIQYGEPEEAEQAVTAIIEEAAKKKSSEEDQRKTAPWLKPGETDNITERNRMMDLIVAKNKMSDARSAAEQGRADGIRRHFTYRFPELVQNSEMFQEAVERVNQIQQKGGGNEWHVYERAAKATLEAWGRPDPPLTEERLLEIQEKFIDGPAEEPRAYVEPVPNVILEGTDPKQARGRLEAIAQIKAMRGQPLD